MPPLIKDYVEFRKVDYLSSITSSNLHQCLRTFLPTDNLVELLNRLLDSICSKIGEPNKSSPEPASVLLTGGHGVGKTHLLSVLFSLIGQRGVHAQGPSDPRLRSNLTAIRQLEPLCIWLDLSEFADIPLPELVLTKIHDEYQSRFNRQVVDRSVIPGIDTIKAHEIITFNIAKERPIVMVIDGLSKRAEKRDAQQLNADIEFLSFMGYSSKSAQLFLLVAAHEDFFSPRSPLGIDSTLMAQTLENFKIEWIDRANLKEIIVRHIFRKNPRQQQDVKKLYAFIKAKLPNFQYTENEFCDTYPFHPLIFDLAERIKCKAAGFSLLDFVSSTFPKVASHRAISLVTIDSVFDRLEYEIKTNPQSQRLYLVYMNLAEQAVPRLQDRFRLWGKMLLKATFLFTLADRNPTVRDLADALLLFEDSEGLSYNLIGMLLGQMEKAVDKGFTTSDDRLDRTYRLGVGDLREELNRYLADIASQIPDSDLRLAEILPLAGADIFPDWPLSRDLSTVPRLLPDRLSLAWRGTERFGHALRSVHFLPPEKLHSAGPGAADLANGLPIVREPFQDEEPEEVKSGPDLEPEVEWLLWMQPIGLPAEAEASLKVLKSTEIHWLPAAPSTEELEQLKLGLALRLTERSASSDFSASDLNQLREELGATMSNLFRELYLFRGRILIQSRTLSLNQGHQQCRTFRSFAGYLFKPNFDQLYSLHPDFGGEQLSEDQVIRIVRDLFAGQDPANQEVQRLAGKFALPLGLVSQTDGLYELNLSITPPIFLSQILQYLETLDAVERPLQSIYRRGHRSPFGLTQTSLHLILGALAADGQIELVDSQTNTTISRENSASIESFEAFDSFRRVPSHKDYPLEVLTQWCRLVTGKPELSDISASRGRESATNALNEWTRNWRHLGISRRLESLPNEFLTTQMWRRFTWTKHRFEQLAECVEQILQKEMTLMQGMGKIVDLFGENIALLEKASRELVELSHFVHWMEEFLKARRYLLVSEKTLDPQIEDKRQKLLQIVESPHDLIAGDRRSEFDNAFQEFKLRFIDHYATWHEQTVGPLGKFERLVELECAQEKRNLQLLSSLPLGDPSYLDCLDEWIADFRDHQCTLPVRDLLHEQPHCQCSFKLSHQLDMGQVIEDLKSFFQLGIGYHKQILSYYQPVIDSRLAQQDESNGKDSELIRSLLAADPLPDLTQEVIDQVNSCLNQHLLQEKLATPIPAVSSTGHFSKRELQSRIQNWLDSLSDEEGVIFTLKDF